MEIIKWAENKMPKTDDKQLAVMTISDIEKVKSFHESFPQYTQTPLVKLDKMAEHLGVKEIYLKDESYRFGLNAFKVLGGSFAMARYIAKEMNMDVKDLPYDVLTSDKLREEFGQATFFTATDGNHGRGVAWAANKLRQKAVVHMPIGTTQTRLDNILAEGATADITTLNYDDCVRLAAKEASETPRGVIVQDTAWDGYEEIPAWIMQGYGTMAMEAEKQLAEYGCERPTHVFVQAGVGSLAGSVVGYFTNLYPDNPPTFVVVEADVAACLYEGAAAADGEIRMVGGDMQTIMAGLACGEPNTISWDILKNHVKVFIAAPDWVAAKGMRMLAAPIKGDAPVTSGESGAAPFGALAAMMSMPEYADLKEAVGLDENSRVLLFSTEGDTDPERYRNIVWEGKDR
ncbi:MAG: diaminopropionate ammonia-lyase [Ruminococcaceae bacterium]|nr:diaminopropionate ammonia-lyase [Oscillospiraceae bacterium]